MENIVQLSEYRKRRHAAQRAVRPQLGSQYYCTRCDSDAFNLSALGMVHCAHCGALMRNLLVGPSPSQEAG